MAYRQPPQQGGKRLHHGGKATRYRQDSGDEGSNAGSDFAEGSVDMVEEEDAQQTEVGEEEEGEEEEGEEEGGEEEDDDDAVVQGDVVNEGHREAELSSSHASDEESDLDQGERREKRTLEIKELKKTNKKLRKDLDFYKGESEKAQLELAEYKASHGESSSGNQLRNNEPAMPVIVEDPRAKRFVLGVHTLKELDKLPVGTDLKKKKCSFPHLIMSSKSDGARTYMVENTRNVKVSFSLYDKSKSPLEKATENSLRDDRTAVFQLELVHATGDNRPVKLHDLSKAKTSLYVADNVGPKQMVDGTVTWEFKFTFTSRDCKHSGGGGVFRLVCRYKSDPNLSEHIWASSIPFQIISKQHPTKQGS